MGRLTETLRDKSVRSGGAYEIQGNTASKEGGGDVTSAVDGTMVGPTGPMQSGKPSVSPDALKSKIGPDSI